ncbi:hypothetical protein AAII07_52815 [Microvirga sp. 0TCS3.31]
MILWIEDEEAPPTYPVTVGVRETNTVFEIGVWRVFSAHGSSTRFDQHIRGWMPLPRVPNA